MCCPEASITYVITIRESNIISVTTHALFPLFSHVQTAFQDVKLGLRRTYQNLLVFKIVKAYTYQHEHDTAAIGRVKFILLFSVYDRTRRSRPWSRTVVFLLRRHYQMSKDECLKDTVAVLLDWSVSNGIYIHPGITVGIAPSAGIAVFSNEVFATNTTRGSATMKH